MPDEWSRAKLTVELVRLGCARGEDISDLGEVARVGTSCESQRYLGLGARRDVKVVAQRRLCSDLIAVNRNTVQLGLVTA